VIELEMYGTELRIENRSGRRKRYLIRRRESEPSGIKELHVGSEEMVWNFHNGRINFEIEVGPGQSKIVDIRFHALAANGSNGDNLLYTLKAMLRRYLCEIRDNYIMPTKSRLAGLTK